jgi:hypothetical protein
MPSSYPRRQVDIIDITKDSSSSLSPPPPASNILSRAQYTQFSSQAQPQEIKDYFQRAPHQQAIIEEKQPSHKQKHPHPALSSVASTTSEIRSQRIQSSLIATEQRISNIPEEEEEDIFYYTDSPI